MSNDTLQPKRYRLLKDLPDGSTVGDVYEKPPGTNFYFNVRIRKEATAIDEGHRWETWQVENNEPFFELIPAPAPVIQEGKEIIEVVNIVSDGDRWNGIDNKTSYAYQVCLSKKIKHERFPEIKQAIEQVLNDEPMVGAASEFNDAWELELMNISPKDMIRINGQRYFPQQ